MPTRTVALLPPFLQAATFEESRQFQSNSESRRGGHSGLCPLPLVLRHLHFHQKVGQNTRHRALPVVLFARNLRHSAQELGPGQTERKQRLFAGRAARGRRRSGRPYFARVNRRAHPIDFETQSECNGSDEKGVDVRLDGTYHRSGV